MTALGLTASRLNRRRGHPTSGSYQPLNNSFRKARGRFLGQGPAKQLFCPVATSAGFGEGPSFRIFGWIEKVSELGAKNGLVSVVRYVHEDVAAILLDPVMARALGAQAIADPLDCRMAQPLMQQKFHASVTDMAAAV